MRFFLLTLLIGVIVGIIDILPMIKMKLDKYSIVSAFVFYLIMPFMVYSTNLLGDIWWLRGGVVAILIAIPTIIMVAKEDKKSAIPMVVMSIILGSIVGVVGHYLNLM